jgi:hypothetical protein
VLHLFKAATAGDAAELERLLTSVTLASYISCEDEDSWTPLHHAVDGNHLAAARVLLSRSAAVNAATSAGDTPLHLALRWNFVETALLLLEQSSISVEAQVSISFPAPSLSGLPMAAPWLNRACRRQVRLATSVASSQDMSCMQLFCKTRA